MNSKVSRYSLRGMLIASLCVLVRSMKITPIIGLKTIAFSPAHIVAPLAGLYGGWQASLVTYGLRTLLREPR